MLSKSRWLVTQCEVERALSWPAISGLGPCSRRGDWFFTAERAKKNDPAREMARASTLWPSARAFFNPASRATAGPTSSKRRRGGSTSRASIFTEPRSSRGVAFLPPWVSRVPPPPVCPKKASSGVFRRRRAPKRILLFCFNLPAKSQLSESEHRAGFEMNRALAHLTDVSTATRKGWLFLAGCWNSCRGLERRQHVCAERCADEFSSAPDNSSFSALVHSLHPRSRCWTRTNKSRRLLRQHRHVKSPFIPL